MAQSYTKKVSPMPWTRDELFNIYDAEGRLIFKPKAFDELAQGVMEENDGNSELIIMMIQEMIQVGIVKP